MNTKFPLNSRTALLLFLLSTINYPLSSCGQGTAFTYQGRLNSGATPANGTYDLRFAIYDSTNNPGILLAGPLTNGATLVSNGLFTATLDFGAVVFDGNPRWLGIGARPGGSAVAYTDLTPRQQLTAIPYALRAANFSGSVADSQLSANVARLNAAATFTGPVSFSNATGIFSGSGAGITNIDLAANSDGAISPLGGFVLVSSPAVGAYPGLVVALDVNGDGKVDLICADAHTNMLTVLTNNGSGGFVLASSPVVGDSPFTVAAADVNGDGRPDLISSNLGTNTLSVLTNKGNGAFALAASLTVDSAPTGLAVADVNGDGRADIVCASYYSNRLSVLTNNGSGGFVLASSPAVGIGPSWVTVADVNGDGKPDLISADYGTNTLTVLTNRGNGLFALASTLVVGNVPFSVVAADVNGDGRMDLISADQDPWSLSVLTNNGSGSFVLASSPFIGFGLSMAAAADVNADGKVDLICANSFSNTVSVLTNDGHGGMALSLRVSVGGSPYFVTSGDVNGDGKVDLITANADDNTLSIVLSTPTFRGAFDGSFSGNGTGLTDLNAANLVGSVPGASLTSVPANNLVGSVPMDSLTSVPAANLVGSVPVTSLTSVPAENLIGSVSPASLTSVPANALTGTISDGHLSANVALLSGNQTFTGAKILTNTANSFGGNGAALTGVNAASLGGLGGSSFWKTGGNAGTTPGVNFLGTTDNQAFELKVNGVRAFRVEPNVNGAPNMIGGSPSNSVAPGVMGATIGGGGALNYLGGLYTNRVIGHFGTVSGGRGNLSSGTDATVGGGSGNLSSGDYSTIAGGFGNLSSGNGATVGGGVGNQAVTVGATIHGGEYNTNSGPDATIGGGYGNSSSAYEATVGGGEKNLSSGFAATVGGGEGNTASGIGAFVGGGGYDGLNHGGNVANGACAVVPGGLANLASGRFSFAAGQRAKAIHDGAFVWADSTALDFSSTAANQFLIRAAGGFGIGTPSPATKLHLYSSDNPTTFRIQSTGTPGFGRIEFVSNPQGDAFEWRPGYIQSTDNGGFTGGLAFFVNGSGSGNTFGNVEVMRLVNTNVGIGTNNPQQRLVVVGNILATGTITGSSDRNVKEHFAPVDPRAVLEKVSVLPITEWNYKADGDNVRHIGPMAQDFYSAFSVGMDDKHISMVDADGVALAAIQGLNQKMNSENAALQAENADLKQRLEALEKIVLHQKPN